MNASRTLALFLAAVSVPAPLFAQADRVQFALADAALFSDGRALTNAVADFDNDGDLDLFVGFNGSANRLYRNDDGRFVDVASSMGVADSNATRTAAWGDYDGDGRPDLFVGFAPRDEPFSRLYRNEGPGAPFRDVTTQTGATLAGSFRQASWVDYDGDGDVDLFVALRDKPNVLLRNDGGRFSDVAEPVGVADPRRTVGAVWFDYDKDGDLDLLVANMDGDANGLFRNDGGRFVDVAAQAGLADGGRQLGDPGSGTVRPTLVDFDNDGNLDVFMANYGPNGLFRNRGDGTFENVAADVGLAVDGRYDASVWGDVDLDGRIDLFVNGTITGGVSYPDYLYVNEGDRFVEATPDLLKSLEADHGALWFDYDRDGDPDLSLTGAAETGMHHILRNVSPRADGRTSLQVLVAGADGGAVVPGAEVRLYDSETGALLGTRIVDTGSGYNSQSAAPVHFGLSRGGSVDVEVTIPDGSRRLTLRMERVDPAAHVGGWLIVSGNQ